MEIASQCERGDRTLSQVPKDVECCFTLDSSALPAIPARGIHIPSLNCVESEWGGRRTGASVTRCISVGGGSGSWHRVSAGSEGVSG